MKLTSIKVRHFKAVESFLGFTGTPIQRQRRGLIPAWGNAPGNGSEMGQGLKARSIPPPMRHYHVTSINANAWIAPLALGDLLGQFHGALPHAGMTAGRWPSPSRPSRILKRAVLPDEIDTVLAGHYGFTAEELDFILNYDTRLRWGFGGQVKYRLGRDTGEE